VVPDRFHRRHTRVTWRTGDPAAGAAHGLVEEAAVVGGILEFVVAFAGVGTAVVLFPILKRQNESPGRLYRARLVPRALPVLGFVGAPLLLAATIADFIERDAPVVALAALPIALWELSLGIWLVAKGFKPAPGTSGAAVV
jgi:hypothetical protein